VAYGADSSANFRPIYELDDRIDVKIEKIATRIYGADGVVFQPRAQAAIGRFTEQGHVRMPVCMAKTHLSLSHDATLLNAPGGFTVPVRDIRAYTGAGWLVALCGEMMTMPGLGATPAAAHVDIDEQGRTVGLF
jgi:formate--tetrahydrofolate ligase